MIQRIQTIYLALALICSIVIIYMPFAILTTSSGELLSLTYNGLMNQDNLLIINQPFSFLPLTILIFISALFIIVNIFLFKNRKKQLILCKVLIFIFLIISCVVYFYIFQIHKSLIINTWSMSISYILPFIAIILVWMSYKAIKRDDNLVKSVDRLR